MSQKEVEILKPIIKYSGGKQREYKYFKQYIPKFHTYYEPFLGGGATFFALKPHHAYLADVNKNLIHFYLDFQKNPQAVMKELHQIHSFYHNNVAQNKKQYKKYHYVHGDKNQKLYYKMRKMFNGLITPEYHYATIYYFINKVTYAGMIRYNRHGLFNVPFGRYLNFNLPNREQIDLLKTATIKCESYQKSFKRATKNDFMFLDPPYDSTFSSYGNGKPFSEKAQVILAHNFKKLRCKAMMVIAATPLILKLYHGYIKDSYGKRYSINIKNRFKSKQHARHLIITNY